MGNMKRTLFFLPVLLGLLWMNGCQNLNPIDPPQELKAFDRLGTLIDTTFYADSAYFIVDKYINTENSSNLTVGSFEGFRASFLLRFFRMPQDSGAVYDSVFIIFTRRSAFPETSDSLKINVSVLDSEWPDSANVLPEWHDYQPAQPFFSTSVSATDSNSIVIPIPTEIFNNWVSQGEANNGLIIYPEPQSASFFLELHNFYSEDPLQWPKLVYRTKLDTAVEHDTTNIGLASTIFDYDEAATPNIFQMAQDQQELIIASGVASRLVVRFGQLKDLSPRTILYKADMQFEVNDEDFIDAALSNQLTNPDHANSYYLRVVSSISADGQTVTLDSTFASNPYYSYSLYEDNGVIHFPGEGDQVRLAKGYLQNFLDGKFSYVWFYLQFTDEFQSLSVKRIHSIKQGGVRLRLRYYLIQNEGF